MSFLFFASVERLGFFFLSLKIWVAYLYSKAIFSPGTALFDVMAVLAVLKPSNHNDYLHLHAPATTNHAFLSSTGIILV